MSAISNGGPAFPGSDGWNNSGMTLRDWFAGQALAGWLASYSSERAHPVDNDCAESVAGQAYKMADAMLAAREASK